MMLSFQRDGRDRKSDEVMKNKINGEDSSSSSDEGMVEVINRKEKIESASKKHALSERKRRKRINEHYDSLRQFFPRLLKTDKASVLLETVRRLKELRDMVAVVTDDGDWCAGNKSRRSLFIPEANDEVSISYCHGADKTTVRAIICCEDRPDLNKGLTEAIKSVRGKAVKAEMATVGGRTKMDVVVEWTERGGGGDEDVRLLRRALKAVVDNRVLGQTEITSRGLTGSEFTGLGRKFVSGARRNVYGQIENKLADGLVVRSY